MLISFSIKLLDTLAGMQEAAKSKIPTLGYGVTYALGNALLAFWGTVMALLMTR